MSLPATVLAESYLDFSNLFHCPYSGSEDNKLHILDSIQLQVSSPNLEPQPHSESLIKV